METRSERLDLRVWRSEVREFCEDTLRQLKQITELLNAEILGTEGTSSYDEKEQTEEAPAQSGEIDSSRSRLESLKRQLSEKLGHAVPTEPPGTNSGT